MTELSETVKLEKRGSIGVLVIDNPPVNALSRSVRRGLYEGLKEGMADGSISALVLACKGRTFIAGADITEFGKPSEGPSTNQARDLMEDCSKPIVAAMFGTALGGGLETALACHFRVAAPTTRFGLPEVKLGILPGGGGTQRLPRLVGVERALEMITSGDPIDAAEALDCGLIDEVIEGDLLAGTLAFAERVVSEGRPVKRIRDLEEKLERARERPEIFADLRRRIARKTRGFRAPESCIQCVEAALNLPFDQGLEKERELFQELVQGAQSKAQRYYFFAERQARKIPDVPKGTETLDIKRCGVLGAGTMGGGIAMNFANAGIPVTLVEVDQPALDRGLGIIRKNYERSAKRGRITQDDVEERMSLIDGRLDIGALAESDIVIEAVFENLDLKKDVFAKFDTICKAGALLATNTSALDVNEIAARTRRPESVIGLHFFSPANVMKLIEVVRGEKTAKKIVATSMELARRIQKIPVLVGVCRGFVGNRMLYARRVEALSLLLEGALPWQVDQVLYDFGFPMGPFAMSDLAGLDIGWQRETSTSSTIREVLCERGRLGQKSGAGYYRYDPETRAASPDPEVEELVVEFSKSKNVARRPIDDEEILSRSIYSMINEGAKILEEGIALRPGDIDVIWVNGYGWPVYRGGPMYHADHVGLENILASLKDLEKRHGSHWQPAPLLEKLVGEGRGFGGL